MVSSQERRRLIEAYADKGHNRAAVPMALAGLLMILAIAVIAAAYYSEEDGLPAMPVTDKPVVSRR